MARTSGRDPGRVAGQVILTWLRIEAPRRRRSLTVLALLIAVCGGTVLTVVAGARRGDSALQRLSDVTLPATAYVQVSQPGFDWATVRALPEVESLATDVATDVWLEGISPQEFPVASLPGDAQVQHSQERPVVLAGRLADPDRADEAVVTARFVTSYGKGVGDTVTALLLTPQQLQQISISQPTPAGPRLQLRIVGVVRSSWFSDDAASHGELLTTPALLREHRANLFSEQGNWFDALVRLRGGTAALPAFTTHLQQATGKTDIDVRNLDELRQHRQRATTFEARWLLAFGAAGLIASLLLVGQAVARYTAATAAELEVLRALGMTRAQAVLAGVAGPVVAAFAGAGIAVTGAVLASRWFPFGSAADAEPNPGVDADWPVLAAGWVIIPILVLAGSVVAAWLAFRPAGSQPGPRHSILGGAAARVQLPVPVVIGARFALEPGRGRTAVPVRPAIFGAVAGVLGVVAAFTFSAGVNEAAGNPRRFGQTHHLETWIGLDGQDITPKPFLPIVAQDPDVTGINEWRMSVASTRGAPTVPLYTFSPVGHPLRTVLSTGRMPSSATEVVLAPESADALRAQVGDTVALTGTRGRRSMTVTGIGFVPAGSHCKACNDHATGGWVTGAGFDTLFVQFQFHGGSIALRPGAPVAAVADRLVRSVAAGAGGQQVQFAPPYPPFAAAEIRQVRPLPVALGVFLAVLAVGAVGHALATAVRRRRHDVAVLRALGMAPRAARGVVLTQASVLAGVGLVFGVPLGLALGRTMWRVVADYTPLQYQPPVAVRALLLVGPLALVVANLLAAWPGHRAARLRVGNILRAE